MTNSTWGDQSCTMGYVMEWGNSSRPYFRAVQNRPACRVCMTLTEVILTPEEQENMERERIFAALLRGNPGPYEIAR